FVCGGFGSFRQFYSGAFEKKLREIAASRAHRLPPIRAGVIEEKAVGGAGSIGKRADECLLLWRVLQFARDHESSEIHGPAQFHTGIFRQSFIELEIAFGSRRRWK